MTRNTLELTTGIITFLVIIIMTIVGNILVIISIFTYRPLKKVQNHFLVSLACADLAVASLVMPFHVIKFVLGKWIFGLILCQFWLTLDILCCTASILNLCAIALDRYWAITRPLKYANQRTRTLVVRMIVSVWVISAVISIPPLIGWNDWTTESLKDSCELTTHKPFVIYSALGSFYIPWIIMSVVYVKIFIAARKRLVVQRGRGMPRPGVKTVHLLIMSVGASRRYSNQANSSEGQGNPQPSAMLLPIGSDQPSNELLYDLSNYRQKSTMKDIQEKRERISVSKEKKAAKTLAIIMGVFVLCWLPFFIIYILSAFCDTCRLHEKVVETITWLGYINSAINPIIYTIFNSDFRAAFVKQLSCCRSKIRSSPSLRRPSASPSRAAASMRRSPLTMRKTPPPSMKSPTQL